MVEKIANWLTRKPKLVAFIAVLLLIPSAIGYISTRINYDILSYLPEDLPSSQGEKLLEDPFKMAATSMLVVEDMPAGYTNSLINEIKEIPGVSNAIWISNLMGVQIPTDMIQVPAAVFPHRIAGGFAFLQERQENRVEPAAETGFVVLGIQPVHRPGAQHDPLRVPLAGRDGGIFGKQELPAAGGGDVGIQILGIGIPDTAEIAVSAGAEAGVLLKLPVLQIMAGFISRLCKVGDLILDIAVLF